jgi:putative heme-binding domain-containing protein
MTCVTAPWRTVPRSVAALSALLLAATAQVAARAAEEDPFAANVRPTEPRTPVEQRAAFKVPEGFEVQLVAHEPDIHKPMNLAFDAAGRLWVTTSREYPTPVPVGQPGRDRVMIFDDFGPDGRARKVSTFADGLNIPIGVYPFRTDTRGWKAIVWSIPNIWLLEDTDGDGKADSRKPLYGPFDHTRDTHGNQASFRRGFDGWLYATHGFNNDSRVTGLDGNSVHLNSGNTYRIQLDGSRIESFTRGQVNPFGLAFDPRGDLYSSDCHSDPIYLLLPGGIYPSFGKPDDGLGFAPNMMEQIRGSTAIDGITYYADDLWPAEYRDCVFIGDVMTSRVYRDLAAERGSGRVTRARPDFIISDDPWFRPVDTTLGPDGAFYVADFYNRIIGHYEVPLNHPGRDRERGRIWRVVHRGTALRPPALSTSLEGLVRELASPSLPRRLLATQEIADRFNTSAVEALQQAFARPSNPEQQIHALWLLRRLLPLPPALLSDAGKSPSPLVRIHARRVASSLLADAARGITLSPALLQAATDLAVGGLTDPAPAVQRASVEALAHRPSASLLRPLLHFVAAIPDGDPHLRYSARRTLRNLLEQQPALLATVPERGDLTERDIRAMLDVSLAVKSAASARFLLHHRALFAKDPGFTQAALTLAARHADPADIDRLIEAVSQKDAEDLDFKLSLFRSLQQGFAQRGTALPVSVSRWGAVLARNLLASVTDSSAWVNEPLDSVRNTTNPWEFQERPCSDGTNARLLSSFPRGEALTGILRSRPFSAPTKLSFFLGGHDGFPDQPAQKRNVVRLLDAQNQTILFEAFPPRNDTAQPVLWDLASLQGRSVVLEAVDADTGAAYAWMAFGRFDPLTVAWPSVAPATVVSRQIAAAEIAAQTDIAELKPSLAAIAADSTSAPTARAAAFRSLNNSVLDRAAADLVADDSLPHTWRVRTANTLFRDGRPDVETLITDVWKNAPYRFQIRFAALAGTSGELTASLIGRMTEGKAPAGLLQDRGLRERLLQAADASTRVLLQRLATSLPSEDETLQKLLTERRNAYQRTQPNPQRGREVFVAACAACHQIHGEGGLVGPQLTGIGSRGEERLFEDVLAPNRNVDHAFWTTTLRMKDGETTSGLFRRQEGELLVLANAAGTEFSVAIADIAERRETNVSVMPSNFGDAIPAEDFTHLMGYLTRQRATP